MFLLLIIVVKNITNIYFYIQKIFYCISLPTISPGAEEEGGGESVDFFDLGSWRRYAAGKGPSPVQSLVTGSGRVGGGSRSG